MSQVVANVAKATEKQFRAKMNGHPAVLRVISAKIAAESADYNEKNEIMQTI